MGGARLRAAMLSAPWSPLRFEEGEATPSAFVTMRQHLYSARVDYDYEHDYDQDDVFFS